MPACLACHGHGQHDFRDMDAFMLEHFERGYLESQGYAFEPSILPCDECESTGTISTERWKDLMAIARARVDQALAAVLAQEGRTQ
jgi:hypothetical protein